MITGAGLQWDILWIRGYGRLGVTNSGMVWNGGTGMWSTNAADQNWQGPIAYSDGMGAVLNDTASGTTTISVSDDIFPSGTTSAARVLYSGRSCEQRNQELYHSRQWQNQWIGQPLQTRTGHVHDLEDK